MDGYYIQKKSEAEKQVPTGRLNIYVTNMPEFQNLMKQVKEEADQLQNTINRLSNFELNIDFGINEPTSSET